MIHKTLCVNGHVTHPSVLTEKKARGGIHKLVFVFIDQTLSNVGIVNKRSIGVFMF